MLFNSINFAIFLPVVLLLYWFVFHKSLKWQNILLLFASYFFYACWDWRFLFLLVFSTLLDYYTGIKIFDAQTKSGKKIWMLLSVIINLGFLGVFKYYNFFIESLAEGLEPFGIKLHYNTIKLILPVGISFYTFHGLSYVLDLYNCKIKPERNFVNYSVFVSFFPLLVAGPIERSTHLLPQIIKERKFEYSKALSGMRQILWGLCKKVVIADRCAAHADVIFNNFSDSSGSTLLLGAIFFAFQIYGDFSGYSDMALGSARLFGIDLLKNFSFPYFSRDIAEFWRRWHISLSSWFRDYIYIPLRGSQVGLLKKIRNIFIIFLISGFWHGANWTFIVWGGLNALYMVPSIVLNSNRNYLDIVAKGKVWPTWKELASVIKTFLLTTLAWIFFRSNNVSDAFLYISKVFSQSIFSVPQFSGKSDAFTTGILLIFFIIFEWKGRECSYALENFGINKPRYFRIAFYYILLLIIFYFSGSTQQFIYFQF